MESKERAARAAVDLVESGMLLGLGSGSTAACVVREVGARLREGRLHNLRGVPSSEATAALARAEGIPLVPLEDVEALDLMLDGADEVDPRWNLIKGGGGAHLREKIVAQSSCLLAIVIDDSKLVKRLGERAPVPVEVVPLGWNGHFRLMRDLGGEPALRRGADGVPFRTDAGNYIIDVRFTPEALANPQAVERALKRRAGVVETGLFLSMASILVVARAAGGVEITRR